MVDNDLVEVVAAAPGIIINKDDGFEDDHCACEGTWNAVFIRHEDGSVAWYGHMKRGSLTAKGFGDTVEAGEYLGVVASSGCSTGPHLHFEVYDSGNNLIDPYAGACNSLNTATWWADQRPYRSSTLNAVLTHSAPPIFGCPSEFEEPNLKDYFQPSESLITSFYYADQEELQTTIHRIYTPSGQLFQEWAHTSPSTYNASYWFRTWQIPSDAEFGEWTVEADYLGETISHNFYVGVSSTHDLGIAEINIYPNPASDKLFIDTDDKNLLLQVFDANGKLIISQKELIIDMSFYPEGVYFFTATDVAGNRIVERIVKF